MNNKSLSEAVADHSSMIVDKDRRVSYQDLSLSFEVTTGNLLLVAHRGAPVPLLLAPESDYTRQADSLGVHDESKIGRDEFDKKYVIRDASRKAKQLLTPEVVALVEALEPFTELELSEDMIRLLKRGTDEASAVKDLENLTRLARAVTQ